MDGRLFDPLDRTATVTRLRQVLQALAAPASARDYALSQLARTPRPAEWRTFLTRMLLLLGTGLLLSGLVTFFAFNWAGLGRFPKFGLIASGITASAVAGGWWIERLLGQVSLTAAAVLTGTLLAVYGQTYQTGADPWGLFAVWAALILPWAVAACFTPLWLLVVALIDVALALYAMQVLERRLEDLLAPLGVVGVHVLAVMLWEWQRAGRSPWLRDTWAPRLLVVTALGILLVEPTWAQPIGPVSMGLLTFLLITIGTFYRLGRPDALMLTAAAACVVTLLTTALGRVLLDTLDLGIVGLLLMTMAVIGQVTLVVTWLRNSGHDEDPA